MIALHTQSLSKYGLNRIFELAKEAEYDGIEIGVDKNNFDTQNAQYIEELSQRYNLPVVALHAPASGGSKSVEHVIKMAEYLNCPVVVVTPPRFLDFRFTNWLKKNIPLLRKKKELQIALLNTPGRTTLGFLPERALNNINDLKMFGMAAIDCSSSASKKWSNLMETLAHLEKILVHVHLSNIRKRKEYSMPNEGSLPLESFLRKLKNNRYKGALSLRVRPSELGAGEDEIVVKQLKKARKFVDEFFS